MWNRQPFPRLSLPRPLLGRPLLLLLPAMMAGILLARLLRPGLATALALLLAASLATFLCLLQKRDPGLALALCAALLGFYLCAGQQAALAAWPGENGDQVVVEGRMLGAALPREGGRYRLLLRVESLNGTALSSAPVYVYGEGELPGPGSRLRVSGECFLPRVPGNPQAFDYGTYLAYQGIAGSISAYFDGEVGVLQPGPSLGPACLGALLREKLNQAAAGLSPLRRGLVLGVFLGDKAGLDYRLSNTLGLAGMLHAFAVSGLNLGFIVAFGLLLLGPGYAKRRGRLWLTLGLILVYLTMTGAAASILRAALMAVTLLLADALGEQNDSVSALALSALISLAVKPLWLFDPGFQLSYGAVLGILVYYPNFRQLLKAWPRLLRESYALTWAATLFTLPLVSYYFWHISWLGWLPAPLVAWGVGLTVLLGYAAAIFALFWPFAAFLLLDLAGWVMETLYRLAEVLLRWPAAASISGSVPLWYVALFMGLLLFLPQIPSLRAPKRQAACLLSLVLAFSLLPAASHTPALAWDRDMLAEVTFIDVGQGDAALIQARDGYTVLIDGGGSQSSGAVGEYILLPYLKSQGIGSIDLIVSSHPDLDHTDGLISVLENLPVGQLMTADCWEGNALQSLLLQRARQNGTPILPAAAGDAYDLGKYLKLTVYHPAPGSIAPSQAENDYSLVCEISCNETDILFTGDAGGEVLARLAADYGIEAEILKLPHHGSETGYSEDFYRLSQGETAIISLASDNSYGHPAPDVVEYWQAHGRLCRTDQQGAISLRLSSQGYSLADKE